MPAAGAMVEAPKNNAEEYDRVYRSSSYDVSSVYDHIIRDFHRVLRRGGKLACTIMAEDNHYFASYAMSPVPDSGMVEVRVRGRIERDFRLYRFRNQADVRHTFENARLTIDDLG
jgi:hypothetical protein